jgi:hypothetical protein
VGTVSVSTGATLPLKLSKSTTTFTVTAEGSGSIASIKGNVTLEDGKTQPISVTISTGDSSGKTSGISSGGGNWPLVNMPIPGSGWWDVACGNGKFAAVCHSKGAAYSTDGETWTELVLPSRNYLADAASGNGISVIADYNWGAPQYSDDGINWKAASVPPDGVS